MILLPNLSSISVLTLDSIVCLFLLNKMFLDFILYSLLITIFVFPSLVIRSLSVSKKI